MCVVDFSLLFQIKVSQLELLFVSFTFVIVFIIGTIQE